MATDVRYLCGHGGEIAFSAAMSQLRRVALVAFAQAGPCPDCAARRVGPRPRGSRSGLIVRHVRRAG